MIEALVLAANSTCTELPPETFNDDHDYINVTHLSGSGKEAKPTQGYQLWGSFSSSANDWNEMFDSWVYRVQTSSSPQPVSDGSSEARIEAVARSNAVDRNSASENVFEIRRLTGMSWSSIGELLNVDRRTINNWAQGRPVKETNKDQISLVLSVLRYVDRGDAELNQVLLAKAISGGQTAINELASGNAALVKRVLSFGEPNRIRRENSEAFSPSSGALLFHEGADGSEVSEPLAFEAKPASTRKRIKRS